MNNCTMHPNSMGLFGFGQPASSYLSNKIIVNNIEDVKQYPVPPGGDYIFSHNTQPILFRKTVDAYGQFKITIFDITQRQENTPTGDFVSINDFNALKAEFEAFKNKAEVINESSE